MREDHLDIQNSLLWGEVALFNTALPNMGYIAKRIAGDLITYIDDLIAI